jgi:L-iditol 2-dehydrogenase
MHTDRNSPSSLRAQGTLQTRLNHPIESLHKLPKDLSFSAGALLEPLAIAMHACARGRIVSEEKILIIGANAVGLLCAAAVKFKAALVHIADRDDSRLSFALEEAFADFAHPLPSPAAMIEGADPEQHEIAQAEAMAKAATGGHGLESLPYDAVIECVGTSQGLMAACFSVKRGGVDSL